MSVQVKHRRDIATNVAGFTPAQGELIVDTTNNRVIVGDGATAGGWPAAKLSEVLSGASIGVANGAASLDSSGHLPASQLPALSGDATSAAGSATLTLGAVNSTPGAFGGAAAIPVLTVNGKGLVTSASSVALNASNVAGLASSATVDTTNASNIGVGTLAMARLPAATQAGRTSISDANYTALSSDRLIAYTSLTAARSVTLCAASAFPQGAVLRVIDESGACSGTNSITLSRAGADTLCGGASLTLNGPYMSAQIESDGVSKWTAVGNSVNAGVSLIGVGAAPDANNPLSVYGGANGAALFNGANFNLTINKSAAGNTASIIFEDGFSGRAQMGLNGSDNYSFKVSANGSTWTTALSLDAATGAASFGNARTGVADANYAALATDREIAYTAITAARTVTLPAAASFPAGHPLVILDESGAAGLTNSVAVTAAGSDTISGRSSAKISTAYGHVRLVSNGASAWTVAGRSANVVIFSTVGASTYTPTPGLTKADVFLVGGGGGGGGGALQVASTIVSGGGGGGGGGGALGTFTPTQIGATQTLTVGAGGAGGSAATTSTTAGGVGGAGGASTFGSLLSAFGGGGGSGGQLGGGSAGGQGGSPYATGSSGAGATGGNNGSGIGYGGSAGFPGITGYYGVGSGGGGSTATGASSTGALAIQAAAGGGSGGGVTAANAPQNGANGGPAVIAGSYGAGGAGTGGAGASPSLTARALNSFFGGGAGGGAAALGGAFAGGAGGLGGGGGGGGGSAQNSGTSGAGGGGGAGYAIIVEYF